MTLVAFEGLHTIFADAPAMTRRSFEAGQTTSEEKTIGFTTLPMKGERTVKLTSQERQEQLEMRLIANQRQRQFAKQYESGFYEALGCAA